MRELILKETFKQRDTSESVTHHDCISWYVCACTHVSESLRFLHKSSAHPFFYLLSVGVFFCFLPALCYLCLCPSWECTETLPISPPGRLVFANSSWNFRCFNSSPNTPFRPRLFVLERRTFHCCQQHLQPLRLPRFMRRWDGLFHLWSHPVKGYSGLHGAVMEGWCIGG